MQVADVLRKLSTAKLRKGLNNSKNSKVLKGQIYAILLQRQRRSKIS